MSLYNTAKKHRDEAVNTRFLRLENDGDKVIVHFIGEPYTRDVYWTGSKYLPWDAEAERRDCDRVWKFAQNVIVCSVENNAVKIVGVKIIEQGTKFFDNLLNRDAKYGVENSLFEVSRVGAKGDSKTTYNIDFERKLTEAEKKMLLQAKLYNLPQVIENDDAGSSGSPQNEKVENAPPPAADKNDSVPDALISEPEAEEIIAVFKGLPDPQGEGKKFCEEFGIARIRELKSSQLAEAREYLKQYLKEEAPEKTEDPFGS